MFSNYVFTKEKIDQYLNELAKSLKKRLPKGTKFEIVIVSGGSILLNYNFRLGSNDIDVAYNQTILKECVNEITDKFNLPNGWLNNDFQRTNSFSFKIFEFSKYYKEFQRVLSVRTITKEYLLAMKLMSFRQYKNDLSDIVCILNEEKNKGNKIDFKVIDKAMLDLYGGWDKTPNGSKEFAIRVCSIDDLNPFLSRIKQIEESNKSLLLKTKTESPEKFNSKDIQEILDK